MLAASRQRVSTARACGGDAPASPQAGVITACSGPVASGSPSRRHSRMTRAEVSRASLEPSAGLLPPARPEPARPGVPAPSGARAGYGRHRAREHPHPGLRRLGHPVLFAAP